MIKKITAENVNVALLDALWWLKVSGVRTTSRNGDVLAAPFPVVTTYTIPHQRVLFSAKRDANPFFHLMEAIWMLTGSNDVAFPATFAKQIQQYSDDGITLNGAYGYRWRNHFEHDQLLWVIKELQRNPHTRRAVLGIWDPMEDPISADNNSLDVPCNTHAYFSTTRGALDMTVCCRSNDAVWGCYGANAVHFSVLHQFVAEASGLPMGVYAQFSNNLHIYLGRPDVERLVNNYGDILYTVDNRYTRSLKITERLIQHDETAAMFLADAHVLVHGVLSGNCEWQQRLQTKFFRGTALPMFVAHTLHKALSDDAAVSAASHIESEDWRIACVEWIYRRAEKCAGAS